MHGRIYSSEDFQSGLIVAAAAPHEQMRHGRRGVPPLWNVRACSRLAAVSCMSATIWSAISLHQGRTVLSQLSAACRTPSSRQACTATGLTAGSSVGGSRHRQRFARRQQHPHSCVLCQPDKRVALVAHAVGVQLVVADVGGPPVLRVQLGHALQLRVQRLAQAQAGDAVVPHHGLREQRGTVRRAAPRSLQALCRRAAMGSTGAQAHEHRSLCGCAAVRPSECARAPCSRFCLCNSRLAVLVCAEIGHLQAG